jgi:hypothetical protein
VQNSITKAMSAPFTNFTWPFFYDIISAQQSEPEMHVITFCLLFILASFTLGFLQYIDSIDANLWKTSKA